MFLYVLSIYYEKGKKIMFITISSFGMLIIGVQSIHIACSDKSVLQHKMISVVLTAQPIFPIPLPSPFSQPTPTTHTPSTLLYPSTNFPSRFLFSPFFKLSTPSSGHAAAAPCFSASFQTDQKASRGSSLHVWRSRSLLILKEEVRARSR